MCVEWLKCFTALGLNVSWNDWERAANLDLVVTNKFEWVDKICKCGICTNEDKLYLFMCWTFLLLESVLQEGLMSVLDIFSLLFQIHSTLLTLLSGPGDWPLWTTLLGLPCSLANKKPQQLMGGREESVVSIFIPLVSFLWCCLGLPLSLTKGPLLSSQPSPGDFLLPHSKWPLPVLIFSGLWVVTAPWLLFSSVLPPVALLNLIHTVLNSPFVNKPSLNYPNLSVMCLVPNWQGIFFIYVPNTVSSNGRQMVTIHKINKSSLKLLLTVFLWFCYLTSQLHIMPWGESQSHWRHTHTHKRAHTCTHTDTHMHSNIHTQCCCQGVALGRGL